jgi:HK97 family phage prohead protease
MYVVFVESELLATVHVADLTKIDEPPVFEPEDEEEENRAVNQEAPAYMRAAARRGLEYYEQGLGGDGLVDRTVREARDMAQGRVTDDKWIRIVPWIARHLVDLDSPNAQPDSENYPSAGVVAHLLWGSGPSKRAAQRTLAYAESVVARIEAEQERDVMTTDVRDKWVDVAYRIKARLEGETVEGRSATKQEKRVSLADFEVRETADGMAFEGYAAVFNSDSQPLPFIERIAPGAFKRSLQSRNEVKLLWNHDSGEPLASVRGGTLKLYEDARGLKVQATLANTTRGRDVSELIRSKTIDSMSFGFSVIKDSWSNDGDTRTLEAVRLFEVSIVSAPAYEATAGTIAVRSTDTGIDADTLADALMRLESGEELDPTQATLITDVVAKLTKTEEVQEVQGDILALKKKKLDLLLKEI